MIFGLILLCITGLAFAADFTPQGNIALRGIYSIMNVTNITFPNGYLLNGTTITTAISGVNSAINGNISQTNTNIQNNWTDLETRKLNTSDQRFNETTYVLNKDYQNSTQVNQSIIDKVIQSFVKALGFYNTSEVYNKTQIDNQIINNGSYFSTYNSTYATWAYNQTPTAGSNITVSGRQVSLDTTNVLVWLSTLFYRNNANIAHSAYNITTNVLFANQVNISNPPVECPSDTFMTRFLGTSSTCEAIVNIDNGGNASFQNLNISGNTQTTNLTVTNQATVQNLTINDGINGNFIIRGNVTIIGNLTISDS